MYRLKRRRAFKEVKASKRSLLVMVSRIFWRYSRGSCDSWSFILFISVAVVVGVRKKEKKYE